MPGDAGTVMSSYQGLPQSKFCDNRSLKRCHERFLDRVLPRSSIATSITSRVRVRIGVGVITKVIILLTHPLSEAVQ